MQELGSHSHSAMSSSGKAAIAPSCLSFECFDTLTKSCIKCSDLFKDNTSKGDKGSCSLSSPGLGGGGPRRVGVPQGRAGRRHLLLRMALEVAMEDEALPSPKQRGRGQPVPVRGTWCRKKSDDQPQGGSTSLRGYCGKSRNSYLLPPRGRERDKGLIKQGDILFLVAGG